MAVVVSLLLWPSLASAAYFHPSEQVSFGPDGTAATESNTFGQTDKLSIDQADDRLYVLRLGEEGRGIYAYDISSPGVYTPVGGGFPIALPQPVGEAFLTVDESEGNIYYTETGNKRLLSWDSSGNPRPGFPMTLDRAGDIAVDPLGYLWLKPYYDGLNEVAYKYLPDGTLLEAVPLSGANFRYITFNRVTGDLWVNDCNKSIEFTAASAYKVQEPAIEVGSCSEPDWIDAQHGVIYATDGRSLLGFSESGDLLETVGLGESGEDSWLSARPGGWFRSWAGLAFDEETGALFGIDTRHSSPSESPENWKDGNITVWPGVVGPQAQTRPPSSVGHTDATLTGYVDPAGGPVTECQFEYLPESEYKDVRVVRTLHAKGGSFVLGGAAQHKEEIPYNASAEEFEEHFVAFNEPKGEFETLAHVTGPPGGPWRIEMTGSAAGDAGQLYLIGNDLSPLTADVRIEWPAQKAPCDPAVSPASPLESGTDVSAHVSGLNTGTTYRYRLAASDAHGRDLGGDQFFTPSATVVSTGAATEIAASGATLNGTVDPEGLETTYYFQYGMNAAYGSTSAAPPGTTVGTTAAGARPVADSIGGLSPGITYHYRIVAVNSKGTSFGVDRTFTTSPAVTGVRTDAATDLSRTGATLHGAFDPDGLQTSYYFEWGRTRRYGQRSAAPPGTDAGTTSPGELQFAAPVTGLEPDTTYHFRIVATNSRGTTFGEDRTLTTDPAVKGLVTLPASEVGTSSATLNGELDPDGFATTFYFQWGRSDAYGHSVPAAPGEALNTAGPGGVQVAKTLTNLEPGTTYHFRLVAVNSFGTTVGADRSFETFQPPSIEGFFSSEVTADSAELGARINPHGSPTTYRFEYGTTTEYGATIPVPDGSLGPVDAPETVTVSLGGLQGVTYHFRVIAESQWGTTTSEDQTFEFNPPSCPNAAVRQQTGAAYLPDCRAYELVSPARAGGAILTPQGPTSPLADDRFAFGGLFNAIPGTGNPPNGGISGLAEDLYVAKRTNSGWVTHYVGLSGEETLEQAGKPVRSGNNYGPFSMLADRYLTRFLTWKQMKPPGSILPVPRSFAAYEWDDEGNALGRLPTNFAQTPGADLPPREGGFMGDIQPSADFRHYVFSSIRTAFAPGGLTADPGSVYDNDIATGTLEIVSKTSGGADIPLDPLAEENPGQLGGTAQFIKIPAVSSDGSHILMSTAGPGGTAHLYLRVNDAVTYEPSLGEDHVNHGVDFAGMNVGGTEVFFSTAAQLTADDHDSSVDLYRWSQATDSLTRLSAGAEGEIGNTDRCNTNWTVGCGVEVVPTAAINYLSTPGPARDSALAAERGDIYFYSPEQLDLGARGIPGYRNLYVSRDGGAPRFVASFDPSRPIEHINVAADGSHMGLITSSRLGSYDNRQHAEMYVYDYAARKLLCVSCLPDGSPPTSDAKGAQDGIFMTEDGRAFFSTADGLVPRDANGITDVYEYVEGRPRLISTGAGVESPSNFLEPGLVGVSADGNNVFLFTTQTLVPQDENGPFFKFYDARTNGGFPYNAPPAPCAAADECHGSGAPAPADLQIGSSAALGTGGNVAGKPSRRKHPRHRAHRRAKHRRHHRHHRHRRHGKAQHRGGRR